MLYSEKLSMLIYHNLTYKAWFLLVDLAKWAGWVSTLDPKPAKRLKYT
jgi:hypothetical protein